MISSINDRVMLVALTATLVWLVALPAMAGHGDESLAGSNFEIDTDANLKVDHATPPSEDWANVTEDRRNDLASGSGDDSFGQGAKEDTEVPAVVSGSIPPNKSDLKTFGVYLEDAGLDDRYLHLFWTRVQDPSGTTNMDFEFNQGETISANGVTPVRTDMDMLIQYDLANGGSNPLLFVSFWLADILGNAASDCEASNKLPCWGEKINLSASALATGSISTSAIPAADSDGLGALSARTFGEATIDFGAIAAAAGGDECLSFGSVYLKSRSADSFTSALKDFIAPIATNVSNCANIKITKQDDAGTMMAGVTFNVFADNAPTGGSYDPPPGEDGDTVLYLCTTAATGMCTIPNVLAGDYWVVEDSDTAPAGHDAPDPQAVTVVAGGSQVELTFTNFRQPASVTINKTDDADNPLEGAQFTLYNDLSTVGTFEGDPPDTSTGKTCTTNASGTCTISDILPPGDYCLDETIVPTGYDKADPQCFTLELNQELTTLDTFVNPRQPGSVTINKVDDASPANPLSGAGFTLYNDLGTVGTFDGDPPDTSAGLGCTTDGSGTCTIGNVTPGDYCVDESTVPAGHDKAAAQCFSVGLNEDVTLPDFVDPRQTGAIKIAKTRKHAADGPGDHPHEGVEFTITGGELPGGGTPLTTDEDGEACLDGLFLSALTGIGDYTATETLPANYAADGDLAKTVTVTAEATCGDGNEATVSFGNTPLTDITVTADSLVDGGTKSTIDCRLNNVDGTFVGGVLTFTEDATVTLEDQTPGTYVCTIVVDP